MAISDFVKKYITQPASILTPGDVRAGVSKTFGGIGNFVLSNSQAVSRGYVGVGNFLSKNYGFLATGAGKLDTSSFVPSNQFEKDLIGTKEPISLRTVGEELPFLKGSTAAPFVGFALTASDLIPGGKITKSAAITGLKNINKVDDAVKFLAKTIGVAEDIAKKYAPEAARLTDEIQLSKLVDTVVRESQDVKRLATKGFEFAKSLLNTPQAVVNESRKFFKLGSSEGVSSQKEPISDLFTELGAQFQSSLSKISDLSFSELTRKIPAGDLKYLNEESFRTIVPKLYLKAKDNANEFVEILRGLGAEDASVQLKDITSFAEKSARKTKDGKNYLTNPNDLLRGTIVVKNEDEASKLFNVLKEKGAIGDNYFDTPHPTGYRGVNTDLKLKDGSSAELQIHTVDSLKKAEAGHALYDEVYKGVTPVLKERGFITSAKEVIPEAEKIAGQYIPRETSALAIKAKNLIRDDIASAEKLALTKSDDTAVAIASELIKKYGDDAAKTTDQAQAAAFYDKAAEIANILAPKLTEQGRAIQAATILGKLTPEGQLRFAAREIQRFNEINPTRKIPELTGEQTKKILDEMNIIRGMPDGTEKAVKFQKLQEYITNLVPTPLIKKITTVWKAGLLTGIKTTGLNLFSNLSHSSSEIIKDIPAAIVDSVASLFTGQRTKTFNLKGGIKGIKEGFEKGLKYFRTGFDERNLAQKLDYTKVNFGKGPIAKIFQTYTDTVFRVMGSSDQPFYYGALARSLGDQAQAQGLTKGLRGKALKTFAEELIANPTEEMLRYAVADASTTVFQNQTYLGKAAKALQNIPVVGEIVVPFGRTPSSVATQIVNYTPVGTAAEIIKQIANKKFDQRRFSEAVGRGLTGTAVLAIGGELGREGLVALDRPTTEKEQKLWELEGRKPNSIKIGDKWRSPAVLGPAGNLLLIGAHFQQNFKEAGSLTEALSKSVVGSLKSFSEQTFLTGINQAVSALNDPERFAESYLSNMVASLVPTLVSDVARATDPLERRAESVPERLQARIPGARRGLEPQVDVLGQERKRIGNPLEVLIDPTRPQKDMTTPVVAELRRLTDLGQKVSPTLLGDKKGFSALTQSQNTELWKKAGEISDDKLESLFGREEYQKLSEEDKGKIVQKVIDQSKLVARVAMVMQLTDGLNSEELKKKLSELKKGGLLTQEVFKKFQELR